MSQRVYEQKHWKTVSLCDLELMQSKAMDKSFSLSLH